VLFRSLDQVFVPDTTDVTFPVLTTTNELYVIDTTNSQPGSTLLVETTTDKLFLGGSP